VKLGPRLSTRMETHSGLQAVSPQVRAMMIPWGVLNRSASPPHVFDPGVFPEPVVEVVFPCLPSVSHLSGKYSPSLSSGLSPIPVLSFSRRLRERQ
jgi:hypothetical protein